MRHDHDFEGTKEGKANCKLWKEDGFEHTVDLYHAQERIAIEVEKTERKYIWRDIAKFSRGGKTYTDGTEKIKFGCLVVPVNYRGRHNLYRAALKQLDFMEPLLFVDDVAVLGYEEPQ